MVLFTNPGLIDLRVIKAFGVNIKPLTDSPLGFFGTGAKYAIAVLLRTGHKVTLYRGTETYRFGVKRVDIRGKAFDFVTLIGPAGEEELPYSLELGKMWEPWQAYRELHSNALDEGGDTTYGTFYDPHLNEDKTTFAVEGDGIEKAYTERATIFLSTKAIAGTPGIEAHPGPSDYVFYRGVRVGALQHPSLFTYNLTRHTDLTEDRTIRNVYDLYMKVSEVIAGSPNADFVRRAITAPGENLECAMHAYTNPPSPTFLSVYADVRKSGGMLELSPVANAIWKSVKGESPLPDPIKLNPIQRQQLDRAIAFCLKAGWEVTAYPIVVIPHAPGNLLGLAEAGRIIVTLAAFDGGVKTIACTLYEEYLHLKLKFTDESRALQNHLFNQVITLAELAIGSAL